MRAYKKHILKTELEKLSDEGLISNLQKEQIFSKLGLEKSSNLAFLNILACIFLGLCLISLVAYNWQNLSTIFKTSLLLITLFLSHILLFFLAKKDSIYTQAVAVLSGFILLANIALLSQIYHLGDNTALAFFSVSIVIFILSFALGSFAVFMQAYLFYFIGFCFNIDQDIYSSSFGLVLLLGFALGVFYESKFLRFFNFIFLIIYVFYSPFFASSTFLDARFDSFIAVLIFLSFIFLSFDFKAYRAYFYFALAFAFLASALKAPADIIVTFGLHSNFTLVISVLFVLALIALNFYKKNYFLALMWAIYYVLPFIFIFIKFDNFENLTNFVTIIYSFFSLALSIYLFKKDYKILALLSFCALAIIRYIDLIGDYIGASILFFSFAVILFIVARVRRKNHENF
ncbi:hypothetical protein DMB92_04950 [Campylobacter sp. MIT 99-7217]|uniref:DUF2157 domain-containing protein n=1 Tax=Campylobacter sp. MIT 99-7217 TaxID=535091 RepID=UPI001156EDE2|nr:DUF2157 domain-containing protein [Campylobacter sp. MIT 99-7217]TQR32448.1 hypothetical protein DMB92_04950 [Campylobacter sp. MIT 99-7217]